LLSDTKIRIIFVTKKFIYKKNENICKLILMEIQLAEKEKHNMSFEIIKVKNFKTQNTMLASIVKGPWHCLKFNSLFV